MAYDFGTLKNSIKDSESWLKKEMSTIRTGMASPAVLDSIKVESYGAFMSVEELGSIAIEDARSLRIMPWDNSQIKAIEKAIITANLGVSVMVDDRGLRVLFPELTSDRRKEIAKIVKERLEEAKKRVRAGRDDVMKDLDKKEKAGGIGKDEIFRYKKEAEEIVTKGISSLDEAYIKKEKEILG